MKKIIITCVFISMILLLIPSCGKAAPVQVAFSRRVAREASEDGWVYSFVNEELKDKTADDSQIIKYYFYGINLRYQYDDDFVRDEVKTVKLSDGQMKQITQRTIPPCLILGQGSEAQERDRETIDAILDSHKSAEELLALEPDDVIFEELDKDMFFRLMRTALLSEPQKEGTDQAYWDKPTYAFLKEPLFLEGYRFQVAFVQETGCVDELFIDVQYQTGAGYRDYVQLSDLVENGTADDAQRRAYETIRQIVSDIKESENYIAGSDMYQNKTIGALDFSRLYAFLNDIHMNRFSTYTDNTRVETIEGTVE